MMPSKKRIIGLTGGIASGKSSVAKLLQARGVALVDADHIARQVVQIGQPAYQQIVAQFGTGILNGDQTINRKALGAIVFQDKAALKKLEAISHPAIIDVIKQRLDALQSNAITPFIVLDAALLLESGLDKLCDEVWLVVVTLQIQIERLRQRDSISSEQARRIIANQMPLTEKQKRADIIIDNNHSMTDLARQVERLLNRKLK